MSRNRKLPLRLSTSSMIKALFLSVSGLALSGGLANAQTTDDGAEEPSQETRQSTSDLLLGSVTVTARKREESLDDLPLSVSAYTGESLEVRGVTQIDSLGTLSPNITFQNNPSFGGSSNSAAVRIRGIGAADFTPTTDPGVGIYVDGVYYARSLGSVLDIIEFDRVEVLRGPQGTLFGRNTIGGAISISTKRPGPDFAAKLSATYGTDDQIDVQGSVNIPLTDKFFVKLTGGSFNQDGFVTRADGIDLGDDSTLAGRLDARWEPTSNFTADFSFDYSRDRENGPALQLLDIRFGPQTIDPSSQPFVFFNNVAATLGGAVPNPLPPGPPPPECATDANPINLANDLCFDDRFITGPDGTNFGTAPAFSDSDVWGVGLTLDWDITENLTAKSITAYRELDTEFARDGDHSPFTIAAFGDILDQSQFSQELQLLGTNFDDRLEWILGLYYFIEDGENINNLDFLLASFQSGGAFENESVAAFGQGTFHITPKLHLTAGLRWTQDERTFIPDQVITTVNPNTLGFLSPPQQMLISPGVPILPSVEANTRIDDVNPLVNLAYDVTDDLLVYGSYSQGFKSGGFTQRVFPPLVPGITCSPVAVECIQSFDPEFVDVIEGGFRYASSDNRYRLSGAYYYTDYSDLQISTFTSVAPVVSNAAAATINGFELELQAAPIDTWFVEASLGYTDADFDEIDPAAQVDINNDFERVSRWSSNIGISKDIEIGRFTATPRFDWSYRSRYFNDAFNSPQIAQDGFSLFDLTMNIRSDSNWSGTVGVRNIGDEEFLATGVFGDAFSLFEGIRDRGRQWFVRLNYEY